MNAATPSDALSAVITIGVNLRREAAARRERRVLVLSGEAAWCRATAQALHAGEVPGSVLWVSAQAHAGVRALQGAGALDSLGTECATLVYDAHSGFDPDAFGAASGSLCAGGLLLLLAPVLEDWEHFPDPERARITVYPHGPEAVGGRFLRRLVRVLGEEQVPVVREGCASPVLASAPAVAAPAPVPVRNEVGGAGDGCRSGDQREAVEALVHVITGQRRRPVVLTSDRGRGKSAAFGIAAARLLLGGLKEIVVTGPRLESAVAVFAHAHRCLPEAAGGKGALQQGDARIVFIAPDDLAAGGHAPDLVLVDEAAAIPAPLLERLLLRYPRIAFATTVHGYEGTGRGFAVRFRKVLDTRTRGWKALQLREPIRWAQGDPLEHLIFRMLLLDAAAAAETAVGNADAAGCSVETIDRDRLAADEAALAELFGLLILAHYRTRPYDLRHLLDGPNLEVFAARHGGHIVGTAVVAREGGFEGQIARGVWEGRIRPHGHLLPESLAAHLGLEAAPRLRCLRIMRIAVHPAAQGRGIGRLLVDGVLAQGQAHDVDYVGSSFGATPGLLRFWRGVGFVPVRMSVKRGAASGAHSVLMLRSLSAAGSALVEEASSRFRRYLPLQLADSLSGIEPELAELLLRAEEPGQPGLDAQDWLDLIAFAFGRRIYEAALGPIHRLACTALADPQAVAQIDAQGRAALIVKVLQNRGWQASAQALGLPGRAQVAEALRAALRPLVLHYGDAGVREEITRIGDGNGAQESGFAGQHSGDA